MRDSIEKSAYRRTLIAIIIITILVILSIIQCSCHKVASGFGLVLEGVGDGVAATGQFIQDSSDK